MKYDVFIPNGKPPGSYANMHLESCRGAKCPTGYLADGYVEMNMDLKSAHDEIRTLKDVAAHRDVIARQCELNAMYISQRAIEARKRRERKLCNEQN